MTYYTLDSLERLIHEYMEKGGEIFELVPGTLGLGTTVCVLKEYKSCVIQERYLNSQSSVHTARFYNVLPKKYVKEIKNRFCVDLAEEKREPETLAQYLGRKLLPPKY